MSAYLQNNKVAEYLLDQLIGLPKITTYLQERPETTISEEKKAKINYILWIK